MGISSDVTGLTHGAHKIVDVSCDFCVSEKCRNTYQMAFKDANLTMNKNAGKIICIHCSHRIKYSGRKNPNTKYIFDDLFFGEINSEEKAYFLGWIASDGSLTKSGVTINIHKRDRLILEKLRDSICEKLPIRLHDDMVSLTINSRQISIDCCGWLGIPPGKKSHTVKFPELSHELIRHFARGYFDGDGSVHHPSKHRRSPRCSLSTSSPFIKEAFLRHFSETHPKIYADNIEWNGSNALDFLGTLYDNASISLTRKKEKYEDWAMWVPALTGPGRWGRDNLLRWTKSIDSAVPPVKHRVSDSGYDLTLIELKKKVGIVEIYDTGIKIQPEYGWYFMVLPRSSMYKTGYIIANSMGVINRSYTGSILVAICKISPDTPDLELPARIVQMIPFPIVHFQLERVGSLDELSRGSNGFGSTGK